MLKFVKNLIYNLNITELIMSKNALIIASFIAAISFGAANTAQADSKYWYGDWSEKHWENQDYEPYYESAKWPHNSQWDYDDWKSSDWIAQEETKMQLINGFYNSDILRDQYMDDGMHVLEIGPNFYKLGGFDKRRVTQVVDEIFGITGNEVFGSFMLDDWESKKPIGIYTQQGLQLQ